MSVYYRYGGPVSTDEALTVPCPLCRRLPGWPCVYVRPGPATPPESVHPAWRGRFRWVASVAQDAPDRTGTPTRQPHNDRRTLFSLRRIRGEKERDRALLRQWLGGNYGDVFEEMK